MTINRSIQFIQDAKAVTDGDGVRIKRSVASRALDTFDPFLLLDEFKSDDAADYIGGFPEHPHRGFETVTYMLEGRMKHRDHLGNEGILQSGGIQWMTAGSGVLHSEMPEQEEGLLHGFQLWINLPASEKMTAPNYQEFKPEQLPTMSLSDRSSVKVIAGHLSLNNKGITGPVSEVTTQPDYFDINLAEGETFSIPLDESKRVLLYVYDGSINLINSEGKQEIGAQQLAMLGDGTNIEIIAKEHAKFLVLAAVPINEPVVNWGPFVMNTQEEIEQAISDYRNGKLIK